MSKKLKRNKISAEKIRKYLEGFIQVNVTEFIDWLKENAEE